MRTFMASAMLLALSSVLLAADDGQGQQPPLPFERPQASAGQELLELFAKVERSLREIDATLWSASAGDTPLGNPEDPGIADLLRQAQRDGQAVQDGIRRILEIASETRSSSSSGGGSQPDPSSGGRPQGEDQTQSQGERTPDVPNPGEQQQQPTGEGPPKSEPREGPDEPDPEDENQEGPMRREETGPRAQTADDSERWGELPQRVRELFRTEGGGDMPARYRDWIDAYYRRLNQAP